MFPESFVNYSSESSELLWNFGNFSAVWGQLSAIFYRAWMIEYVYVDKCIYLCATQGWLKLKYSCSEFRKEKTQWSWECKFCVLCISERRKTNDVVWLDNKTGLKDLHNMMYSYVIEVMEHLQNVYRNFIFKDYDSWWYLKPLMIRKQYAVRICEDFSLGYVSYRVLIFTTSSVPLSNISKFI